MENEAEVEHPEVFVEHLHVDWTEGQTATPETIEWLLHNPLPPNVTGVDHDRAPRAGSENVA